MSRILHVIDTTGPGGAETVFVDLADRIRKKGYRSTVLLRGSGWVQDELVRRGLTPIMLDAKGSFNWRYLLSVIRLVRTERIDLIQSHLLGSNVYCAMTGWVTQKPVVATFHGAVDIDESERFRAAKFWLMQKAVARYVTVSQSLKSEIARAGLLDPIRTQVIYNGVDLQRFNLPKHRRLIDELRLPANARLIGSLGNVRKAKAYSVLIHAAAQVCKSYPDVHFLVAGHIRQSLMPPLNLLIEQYRLGNRIHFLGFREDAVEFLTGLDAFVLSSTSEGLSIATIEAQAAALPVVATRCGGPEEIVQDGSSGMLVPVDHPTALAKAINQLLEKPDLMKSIGRTGQAEVHNRFGISKMVDSYEALYRRLIAGEMLEDTV